MVGRGLASVICAVLFASVGVAEACSSGDSHGAAGVEQGYIPGFGNNFVGGGQSSNAPHGPANNGPTTAPDGSAGLSNGNSAQTGQTGTGTGGQGAGSGDIVNGGTPGGAGLGASGSAGTGGMSTGGGTATNGTGGTSTTPNGTTGTGTTGTGTTTADAGSITTVIQ
jgi:hypothetical protein